MALLQITQSDLDAAKELAAERKYGHLVATGWSQDPTSKRERLLPWFHFANGSRVTLGELPNGQARVERLYPPFPYQKVQP